MKFKLFEFEDLPWFPNMIRNGMTDFLRFTFNTFNFYEPITTILNKGLKQTCQCHIVDLCSGAGGGIEKVYNNLRLINKNGLTITLTDKYPNITAYKYLKLKTNNKIDHIAYAVDAMQVPVSLKGLRVMFSGFHHFSNPQCKLVLKDAVDAKQGIAIFDGGDKGLITMLKVLLFLPVGFIIFTPFIRPFRFSRLFFTYLVPVIPLCTIWDGLVSITRLHLHKKMLIMANDTDAFNYHWEAGKVKNKLGINITYLLGYPKK